ncbi:unnamed protein product [Rhodiola kirilowii]
MDSSLTQRRIAGWSLNNKPEFRQQQRINVRAVKSATMDRMEPVVIRKKAPSAAVEKDEKCVNAARRAGAEIETLKKSTAGTNKAASSSTSLNTRKLDEETEVLAHNRVPTELKKSIMQGRTDKKLTQAQLAQLINKKPQVIQEYESGKAIPNQQIILKLERALSVKLSGKK